MKRNHKMEKRPHRCGHGGRWPSEFWVRLPPDHVARPRESGLQGPAWQAQPCHRLIFLRSRSPRIHPRKPSSDSRGSSQDLETFVRQRVCPPSRAI